MTAEIVLTFILVAVFLVGLACGMSMTAWSAFCDKWFERKLADSDTERNV